MREAGAVHGAYIRHDVHFHALIAEASGNPLIALQVTALSKAARHSVRSGQDAELAAGAFQALLGHHRRTLNALRAHDEAAAVAASQAHFEAATAALLAGPALRESARAESLI